MKHPLFLKFCKAQKIVFTAIGLFFFSISAKAQQEDSLQWFLDTIYSQLDASYMSTPFLYEQTVQISDLGYYDGNYTVPFPSLQIVPAMYDLMNMQKKTGPFPYLSDDQLETKLGNAMSAGINQMVFFNVPYNYIDSFAFDSNLVKTVGVFIVDSFPRPFDPYGDRNFIAMAPASGVWGANVTFGIDKEFFFGELPSSVKVDFGDGKGEQTLAWGTKISTTYLPGTTNSMRFDFTDRYGNSYYGYSSIRIPDKTDIPFLNEGFDATESGNSDHGPNCLEDLVPFWKTATIPVSNEQIGLETSDPEYNALFNSILRAMVTIKYGKSSSGKGQNACITKPIIFVEGVDFPVLKEKRNFNSKLYGFDDYFNKCNRLGFVDFYNRHENSYDKDVNKPYTVDHPFYQVRDLIDSLNNLGYDFIYVDFEKGADFMQRNAMVLVEVIRWINEVKWMNGSCEQTAMVAASMGGQVARYALCYMEKNEMMHDIGLNISFDSPHNGANVPIGFQKMADFFADTKGIPKFLVGNESNYNRKNKLLQPAARQLLKQHFNGVNGTGQDLWRLKFYQDLQAMGNNGFPEYTHNVAISNGNGSGKNINDAPMFNPGDMILRVKFSKEWFQNFVLEKQIGAIFKKPQRYVFAQKVASWLHNFSKIQISPVKTIVLVNLGFYAEVYAAKTGPKALYFKGKKQFSFPENFTSSSLLEMDHVAGCRRSDLFDLEYKKPPFLAGFVTDAFGYKFNTFMPTSSTTALKYPLSDSLNFHVNTIMDENHQVNPIYSYFERVYFSKDSNEAHVRATAENIKWALKRLKETTYPFTFLESQLPNSKGGTYNLVKDNSFALNLSIKNNGRFYVNWNAAGGYFNEPMLPMGSVVNAAVPSCNTITIENGGIMILGGYGHFGNLRFLNGSKLVMMPGSRLIINDSSSVIIDPQAVFEYYGGEIELIGNKSNIEFWGKLLLGNNTTFTFQVPVNGKSGKISFINYGKNQDNRVNILAGANSRILLQGKNKEDEVLSIDQQSLNIPEGLSIFSIKDGLVTFRNPNSRLSISSRYQLINSTFEKYSETGMPRGVEVYGQGNSMVDQCRFKLLTGGITALQYIKGSKLIVRNSKFVNCQIGIHSFGTGVQFLNVEFDNCYNTGWKGEDLIFNSTLQNCLAINCSYGARINGGNNVDVSIFSSRFLSNGLGLQAISGTIISSKCSEFINNGTGISGGYFSTVNLSSDFNAGNNLFRSNDLDIELNNAQYIRLNKGNNKFLKDQGGTCFSQPANCPIISGTVNSSECMISFGIKKPFLKADNNLWINPQVNSFTLNQLVNIYSNSLQCGGKLKIFSASSVILGTACKTPMEGIKMKIAEIVECPQCNIVNTESFNQKRLDEAAKITLTKLEISGQEDYHGAVGLFHEYLTYPLSQQDETQDEIRKISYAKMHESMASEVEAAGTGPINLEKTKEVTDGFYEQSGIENSEIQKIYHKRDLSHLKKLEGDYSSALQPLMEINADPVNYAPENLRIICLTQLEGLVRSGELPKEAFMEALKSCDFSNARISYGNTTPGNPEVLPGDEEIQNQAIKVFPNPSSGEIYIISDGSGIMEIFDLTGKKVFEKNIIGDYNHLAIDLPNGIYQYSISNGSGDIFVREKIVILK